MIKIVNKTMLYLSVAKDFTKTPGFRYRSQSPTTSGQQFRDDLLEPRYLRAVEANDILEVTLDGTDGYLTSFIEEAFGGLQRKHPGEDVLSHINVISNYERHWIDDIKRYVETERARQD